ncbi:MAG: DUF1501 domain-containing protein [Bacteroidota bacterium]
MKKMDSKRFGSALEHGHAHEEDHDLYSRRSFLGQMGLLGGMGMMMGSVPIKALGMNKMLKFFNEDPDNDRILVLIQMKGGNDGLNTMIPMYDYDFYRNQRPTLGIPQNRLIQLGDDIAMPDFMNGVYPMWQEGKMKVIHSVGYQDQNLSHFRSTDIWASGSPANEEVSTGWLGRMLTAEFPDLYNNPPAMPPAIQIGAEGNRVFSGSLINLAVSVTDPEELFEIAQNGQLYPTSDLPLTCYGEELRYMRLVANNTFTYAGAIQEAYNSSVTTVDYEGETNIGEQLGIVARLIKGNLGTKLYLVALDGFDTHAEQETDHAMLLSDIANNIAKFFQDLKAQNMESKVLAMTFSEFGRRIEENASLGTDHGSAAPVLLFGPGVNGSAFVGARADLRNPDEFGNLDYHTDFKSIYATVLQDWMCLDALSVDSIMGGSYPRIDKLILACGERPGVGGTPLPELVHEVRYGSAGVAYLYYNLTVDSRVRIDLFHVDGRTIGTLHDANMPKGTHQLMLSSLRHRLSSGQYAYRIEAQGQSVSKLFTVN